MGTLFICVALLYLCGLSFSQECKRDLLENVDFPGTDITTLRSPDAVHCQYLCTQYHSCLFFSFVRPDATTDTRHFSCFLKSATSGQPQVWTSQQGVTSGFSLKPCNPDPKPCLPQVYQNVNFPGSDYQTLFTADYQECQRACTQDPGCQFFAFIKTSYKCYLKFSWTEPRIPEVEAKAGLVSGFSHRIQTSQYFKKACQGKLFPSTDIPGNDTLTQPAVSPEHCQTLCSAHPLCTYFSYKSGNFDCYLKNNPNQMIHTAAAGITSGLPARFCQLDNSWIKKIYGGIEILGSDIRSSLVDNVEACQRTCTEDPNCQFYTYITDRRRCYLKRAITMPAPPGVDKYANIVSGFSLNNCLVKLVINSGSSYRQTILSSTCTCTTIGFLYIFSLIPF